MPTRDAHTTTVFTMAGRSTTITIAARSSTVDLQKDLAGLVALEDVNSTPLHDSSDWKLFVPSS